MKKLFVTFVVIISSAVMFAQNITAYMTIQLKSQSNNTNEAYLFEASDFQDPVDATNSASLFPYTENTGNVNVFLLQNETKYSQFAAKTISNLPIGVITNREAASAQNYQLIFSDIEGRALTFYDMYLDSSVVIPSTGFTYDFTVNTTNCPSYVAGNNITITNRFFLEPIHPTPVICHRYGQLQVTGYVGDVVVKDMSNNPVLTEHVIGSEDIDLSTLASGQYQVEFNGDIFIISVNPEVTIVP